MAAGNAYRRSVTTAGPGTRAQAASTPTHSTAFTGFVLSAMVVMTIMFAAPLLPASSRTLIMQTIGNVFENAQRLVQGAPMESSQTPSSVSSGAQVVPSVNPQVARQAAAQPTSPRAVATNAPATAPTSNASTGPFGLPFTIPGFGPFGTPAASAAPITVPVTASTAGPNTAPIVVPTAPATVAPSVVPTAQPTVVPSVVPTTVPISGTRLDVRAFGARGDGIVNDTAAIQAAIDAARAGETVFFSPGTYRIGSAPLRLKSDVRLLGSGGASTLHESSGNMSILSLNQVDNVTVEGLRFTGTGMPGTDGRGAIWAALGQSYGTRGSRIINNIIEGVGTSGIVISHSSSTLVSGNTVSGTKEHGIYVSASADVTVTNNTVTNAGVGTPCGACSGIKLANAVRARVTGNVITSPSHEGILFENGTTDSVASGNTVRNAPQRSIRIQASTARNVVSGNILENATGDSIRIFGGDGHQILDNELRIGQSTATLIKIDSSATNTKIAGNTIARTSSVNWAIDLAGDNGLAERNHIAGELGIAVRATANATQLLHNEIAAAKAYLDGGTGTILVV